MGLGTYLQKSYESASSSAKQAFDTMSQAVSDTGEYLVKGAAYAKNKAVQGAEYVSDKVVAAKDQVKTFLAPKQAGSTITHCPNKTKAQRVALREDKIAKAQDKIDTMAPGADKSVLENATTRFQFNNKAVERARLAEDVYSMRQEPPPGGWKRVDLDEIEKLDLDPDDFPQLDPRFEPEKHKDGFFVDLYKTDPDVFGEEKYVLSFRGTQSTEDWKTNAKQAIGLETDHYTRAINLANKAQEVLQDKLEITGHSLGGGMATAAGITSGTKTYAYNPAGVHPATLERAGDFSRDDAYKQINGQPLVDNVVITGELLTALQNPTLQRSVIGAAAYAAPVASVVGLSQDRAFIEQGTVTYGMAGVRHDVPLLGNAKEVADAAAKGKSIQGMTPSKAGKVSAAVNPVKKIEMHVMHNVIAGIEQQKADDMNVIDQQI